MIQCTTEIHHLNCYATTMILNTGVAPNVKLNFANKVFPDISLTAVKFCDISRFPRPAVAP